MKETKYLACDGINNEYEEFKSYQDACIWLQDCFFVTDEGYHPDLKQCMIYRLDSIVDYDLIKVCEPGEKFDEIWTHKFVRV